MPRQNNNNGRQVRQPKEERKVPTINVDKPDPTAGTIQTHNVYSRVTIGRKITDNNYIITPYATLNVKVDIGAMNNQVWKDSPLFKNKLTIVINQYAKSYFTEVDPALISDIADEVKKVVQYSSIAYAKACTAVRLFNCQNIKDVYGRSVAFLATHYEDMSDIGDPNHILWSQDWNLTNSAEIKPGSAHTAPWVRKEIIGPMCGLAYISPMMKSVCRGLFTGIVKQKDGDSDTARYITFWPEFDTNDVTFATLRTEIKGHLDTVQASIAKYPFLTNILESCGLTLIQAPDFYDLDQTQNTLDTFIDENDLIRDTVDHFSRSAYAVTDDTDLNTQQYAVEDNDFLKERVMGPNAILPLFKNVDYISFMSMMMGNLRALEIIYAQVQNDAGTVKYLIQGGNPHVLLVNNPGDGHDAAKSNIMQAAYIFRSLNVCDLDESWKLKAAQTDSGLAFDTAQYQMSLASYFIPMSYNTTIRELAYVGFYFPRLAADAQRDTNKQDVLA